MIEERSCRDVDCPLEYLKVERLDAYLAISAEPDLLIPLETAHLVERAKAGPQLVNAH